MVNPDTAEIVAEGVVSILPTEVANQLIILVQAIGGLFILYLIFLGIRLYYIRNQNKKIKEMGNDIKLIKKKLKIK